MKLLSAKKDNFALETKQEQIVKKMFMRFFVPSLISSLGLSLGGIADSLVIGNVLGEEGLAAIGFTAPIYMIFNVFSTGIGIGGSIYYSRYLSEGSAKKGLKLFNSSLFFAAILSVVIAACGLLFLPEILHVLGASEDHPEVWEYTRRYASILFYAAPIFFLRVVMYFFVRSDDSQVLASVGMVIGNVVDIILNFVLIFGLDMGVEGAAYSTIIGVAITAAIYFGNLLRKTSILSLRFVRPSIALVWKSFRTGFASSSQYLFQFITLALVNNILMRRYGQTEVAVFDVVLNVSYIVYSIADAAGATIQPIVSTFYGERNRKAIKLTLRHTLTAIGLIGIPAVICLYLFSDNIAMFFGLGAGIGKNALNLFALGVLFALINIVFCNYYQSIEQIKRGYIINTLRSFVLYLIFAVTFAALGNEDFWWLFLAIEAVTFLLWSLYNVVKKDFYCLPKTDESRRLEITIVDKETSLANVIAQAEEFCDKWEADMKQTYYVTMTVEEICSAIIINAFKDDSKYIELTLIVSEDENGNLFTLHLRDNASSFNPFNLESRKMSADDFSGLDNIGILMVKEKAKDFFYRRYQGFNTLIITV